MRQIRILSVALDDLRHGRNFYEQQQAGVGEHFLDCRSHPRRIQWALAPV